jgi:predicted Ser/Thr protein kinase
MSISGSSAFSSFDSKLTFDRRKVLGKGGFSTVYEGAWGGVKVAVKRFFKGDASSNEQEEKALKMLDHVNVIKLFHVEEDQDFKYLKIELACLLKFETCVHFLGFWSLNCVTPL